MIYLFILSYLLGTVMGRHWSHGGIPDTPEVEAAKAKHFAAHAKVRAILAQIAHSNWNSRSVSHHSSEVTREEAFKKWTGPTAFPPGYDKYGAPLPVEDTHEVSVEKARHFELYSRGAYAGSYVSHTDHYEYTSPSNSEWPPTLAPWTH